MADTTRKLFNKMTTGSENNTWGTETNTNWDEVDKSLAGVTSSAVTAADVTLTDDQARSPVQITTGTLTGNRSLIVPSREAFYLVKNNCAGAFTLTVKTTAGTGVVVPQGGAAIVECDATNVVAIMVEPLKGTAIASGATVTFPMNGYYHITGTTTITDFDWTTAADGNWAWVIFDGILTLTHHATTLLLPSGANITTAANDRALFVQDSADNVICLDYIKAAGTPLVGGSAATETAAGIVELLTDAETQTGTDTTRAMTAANLTAKEATAAQFVANTADRILTTDQVWSAASTVALTDAATVAVDLGGTKLNFTLLINGNRTLGTPSNAKVGQSFFITITKTSNGQTLVYHADYKWAAGVDGVLSTSNADTDVLFCQVLAANFIYASLVRSVA
jgi:hypothetical protein